MDYAISQLEAISLVLSIIAALGIAAAAGIIKAYGGVDDATAPALATSRTISSSDPGYEFGLDTSLTWRGYWQYAVAINRTFWAYVWAITAITAINILYGLAFGALLGMIGLWWLGALIAGVFWVIDMVKIDWDIGGWVQYYRTAE
jgi:hypothetical protein